MKQNLIFGIPVIIMVITNPFLATQNLLLHDKIFSRDKTFCHGKFFSLDKTFFHDKIFSGDNISFILRPFR